MGGTAFTVVTIATPAGGSANQRQLISELGLKRFAAQHRGWVFYEAVAAVPRRRGDQQPARQPSARLS
jgi:hypothetical protein